ncbi:MAG: CHAT domain-containing protein [Oscillatoriales cyanobacterium]|jgi:CHAT domain-containing protein|nr:MAG: CHAT domain-containing protein [Oscillatoriales cyanobacterium]
MKVLFIEVCRNPEIEKSTDTRVVSDYLKTKGIDYKVFSNDGIWPQKTKLTRAVLASSLNQPGANLVHLSSHGDENGLVLQWTEAPQIRDRRPNLILSPTEIATMSEWSGKLVVTASSTTTVLADKFLQAGALGVVSPDRTISWRHVNSFLEEFYEGLASRKPLGQALSQSSAKYPELAHITIHAKRNIDSMVLA